MSDMAWYQQLTESGDNLLSVVMGRTYKDAKQNRVLEIVKRQDGTFDLFLNRTLYRGQIHPDGLPQELCVRFGYRGQEYDSILWEVEETGRKELFF
jgi:hypothetical protein